MAPPVIGDGDATHPGVQGTGPIGVQGTGVAGIGIGVLGVSGVTDPLPTPFIGVKGDGGSGLGLPIMAPRFGVVGTVSAPGGSGVSGSNSQNVGVSGTGKIGVSGTGQDVGVDGFCGSAGGSGVHGIGDSGTGVLGESKNQRGVWGKSENNMATVGDSINGTGIYGHSINGPGVYGEGKPAGRFVGDLEVTGNVHSNDVFCGGGDCAEDFDICGIETVEPGTVMVIEQNGSLKICESAYDKRVAGVVSGAGGFKPGLILDRQQFGDKRVPIALLGKVYCKVDAQFGAIDVGDLLTTSPTPGHAMKAVETLKAFGAVIGKALRPLESGTGLIPIFIALQ